MFNVMLVQKVLDFINRNRDEEEGQGLVEYALILVLIAVVAIAILRIVGNDVSSVFASISSGLQGATD